MSLIPKISPHSLVYNAIKLNISFKIPPAKRHYSQTLIVSLLKHTLIVIPVKKDII